MDLNGKKITVVGLGESGKTAALFLKDKGAQVYATELVSSEEIKRKARELEAVGINVEIGRHTEEFIKGASLMVVSPGVMDRSPIFLAAKKRQIPIISEIELGSWFCKVPIIAVTGTNGKSTTVTLIDLMLEASGKKPILCGNIGNAFCGQLTNISPDGIVVLEASSFQLKRIKDFKPHVAIILNIDQNHFDWHPDFKDYFNAKQNIYKNQTEVDYTILNYDDIKIKGLRDKPISKVLFFSLHNNVDGACCNGKRLFLKMGKEKLHICDINDIKLKGDHNKSNVLCASLAAYLCGATLDGIRNVISKFNGLVHRFQDIGQINGVSFIDDSKATTVSATRQALVSSKSKTILIAGGRDKGSDFIEIRDMIKKKVKALVLIGEARAKIRKALKETVAIYDANNMDEAVFISFRLAEKGDMVLLSPMCASFDIFKDYKHRGEAFCKAVGKLKQSIRTKHKN